jgi:Fe-S oxidoreductase/coenzyme F420-reducing hydrogenase delta subunit
MDPFKIVLFICNWGPHAAYQALQEQPCAIPAEVRMVRIPCTGRISKSLLFKAFEMGSDGVALMGCMSGSCRYGTGTTAAERNVSDMRDILELLGLGRERLRWATFLPEESPTLHDFLKDFTAAVQSMGKNPISPSGGVFPWHDDGPGGADEARRALARRLLATHDVSACLDCGKCTSACPVALSGKTYSPRAIAASVLAGEHGASEAASDVWSCLTCGLCYDRCPSAVHFPEFIRDLRAIQRTAGSAGSESHGGFFQSLMRAMACPELGVNRESTTASDIRTAAQGKILYFGGCAPYFDIFFRHHLPVNTRRILADSLRLLNFFDIVPVVLNDERCCGHDLLWSGDRENFLKLARLNVDGIVARGVEEVVTSCPECYRAFAVDYPEHGVTPPFKVTHLFDLLEREIAKGAVGFDRLPRRITFQDPCRLSRLGGTENIGPELPRKLLGRLQPRAFTEMAESGVSALCCGNCAWTGCDAFSKALQVKRLRQAHATGCDLLVTACPKCQIHLRCAMEDPFREEELELEMMDLATVMARTIHWK